MKFEKPEERKDQDGGGDLFLKVKDGHPVTFTPRGEIYKFYSVFGTKGAVLPSTPGARIRYRMNVVMSDDGGKTFKARVYEFGPSVYNQLYEIAEVCEITTTKLRLSRRGSTKDDTEYNVLPMMKEPLSQKMIEAIQGVELHILDRSASPQQAPPGNDEWPGF